MSEHVTPGKALDKAIAEISELRDMETRITQNVIEGLRVILAEERIKLSDHVSTTITSGFNEMRRDIKDDLNAAFQQAGITARLSTAPKKKSS